MGIEPMTLWLTAICSTTKLLDKKILINIKITWKMGFEPTTFGMTNHHSTRLSYSQFIIVSRRWDLNPQSFIPKTNAIPLTPLHKII